jgi:hypothetical protein
MNLDLQRVRAVLMQNQIIVRNIDSTIRNIAIESRIDSSKLFSIILEQHIWNVSKVESHTPLQLRIAA